MWTLPVAGPRRPVGQRHRATPSTPEETPWTTLANDTSHDTTTSGTGAEGLPRRRFLKISGLAGIAAATAPLPDRRPGAGTAPDRRPGRWPAAAARPDTAGAPPADLVHLQFGADTAHENGRVVDDEPAGAPAERFASARRGADSAASLRAQQKEYTEAITGETVWTYHALLDHLWPDTDYVYDVMPTAPNPCEARFRTAAQRSQAVPLHELRRPGDPRARPGSGAAVGPNTPNAAYVVDALGGLDRQPLFHLLNGDLCYANVQRRPVATWRSFFAPT